MSHYDYYPTNRRDILKGLTAGGLLACAPFASSKPAVRGKTAVVIGAGISGLSAAYELRKAGFAVSIFEKREWSGGRMREAWMGPLYGFTHAAGVLSANKEMFSLATELGMADELKGPAGLAPIESEWGEYGHTARWRPEDFTQVPGLSADTLKRLPVLLQDLERIRAEVDPCLLATGASYDDESLGDYYERMLGKEGASEIIRYWIEPALSWWGWPTYMTSKIALLSWFAATPDDFMDPRGGIGVLTRKLASLMPIQQRVTVRYITPPDSSGRHTIHYLTPEFEARTVTPDVVVLATEGKFVYPLVQGLSAAQESFFKAIDFTKEAIIWYILKPEAAPAKRVGGHYTASHPDRMKRRTTAWDVNPAQPESHNRPATARVALSRPETPNWQMSNQPMEKYCEPIIKHFYPDFDMRNVVDIVNYTCDDLIQIPVGYVRQMAAISREQEKERRGLYFAGEYMAHAHTGASCASGRTVARTIVKHWS
jgi:oxygen-dependent protoporphyrinogen oxidase